MVIPVYCVLLPDTLLLDVAGPAEALRMASLLSAHASAAPKFDLRYIGPAPDIVTSIGLPLAGLAPLPDALPTDAFLLIAGTISPRDAAAEARNETAANATAQWLRRAAPAARRIICICSGALLAARAGLLDGRQCTTHHSYCDVLRTLAPRAKVLENRIFVTDGPISTSAGVTAGIDLALQLIAELAGPCTAAAVARSMVVYMRRTGADPQLSPWLTGRNHLHPALHRVQDALAADPAHDWSLDEMAAVACSSSRHLARLFQEYAGTNPVEYLHRLRIALARDLLAHSSLGLEHIAVRAGFGSTRQLRRVWQKYDTQPPSRWRQRVDPIQ